MMRFWSLLVMLLVAVATTARLQAQATVCNSEQDRQTGYKLPSGEFNNFIAGNITVRCPSKKIVLKADSAEIYGDEHRIFLIGHVHYVEPRLELTSDYLTYYQVEERIVASGNVNGKLPTGSTLKGPQVDYKRLVPRLRPRAQTLATGRPTVTIVQRDTSGKEQPPIDVIGNTIFMDGDSLIYGSGNVQITRPEVNATGDSAFINTGTEIMQLMRNPVVNGTKSRPFRLVGTNIDLFSKDKHLQRVIARARAQANSQDLTLTADTIDLRIRADSLERAFAWGKSRARAVSPTQNMIADSLDVQMPSQRVREVHALHKAFAEGRADSIAFKADTTNWLRGDTIFAYFDTLPPADTSKGPEIRKLISKDSAEAYYHIAPQDTTLHRPAINFVRGEKITIDFNEQKVAQIAVDGRVSGVYIEPSADTTTHAKPNQKPPARPPSRPGAVPGVRRP